LLALLGAHHIFHIGRIRVKEVCEFCLETFSIGRGNNYFEYGKWLCRGPVLANTWRYRWVTMFPERTGPSGWVVGLGMKTSPCKAGIANFNPQENHIFR
jgi:hypothetical protein